MFNIFNSCCTRNVRKKELVELLDQHRSKDGSFDVPEDDFWEVVDRWRLDRIWHKVNNEWKLKHPIR